MQNRSKNRRIYDKAYRERPDVKERAKANSQRQEVKERIRAYRKLYDQRPVAKKRKATYQKVYQKAHHQQPEVKERDRARDRGYHQRPEAKKKDKAQARAFHLRQKYGLTLESFEAMLIRQDSVCIVCGTSEWGYHGPCVDHDHSTGAVRGILCFWCNAAAGMINDDEGRARKLAGYLRKKT